MTTLTSFGEEVTKHLDQKQLNHLVQIHSNEEYLESDDPLFETLLDILITEVSPEDWNHNTAGVRDDPGEYIDYVMENMFIKENIVTKKVTYRCYYSRVFPIDEFGRPGGFYSLADLPISKTDMLTRRGIVEAKNEEHQMYRVRDVDKGWEFWVPMSDVSIPDMMYEGTSDGDNEDENTTH